MLIVAMYFRRFEFLLDLTQSDRSLQATSDKRLKDAHPACPIARSLELNDMNPIYLPENCQSAFQLNWSVAVFGQHDLPPKLTWYEPLKTVTEADGVRILEVHIPQPRVVQFLVSTRPDVAPSDIVRLLKGRWQYMLRSTHPSAFRRNYFIGSVGDANSDTLNSYVAHQIEKHPMADDRITAKLAAIQFHDPKVALDEERVSSHGKFVYSLQVVVENVA